MNQCKSGLKGRTWLLAAFAAASMTACGSGEDGKVLGVPGNGAGNPGPAGAAPALGAAAAFGAFGGNAGITNSGNLTVISGAAGQPVSIGTTGAST